MCPFPARSATAGARSAWKVYNFKIRKIKPQAWPAVMSINFRMSDLLSMRVAERVGFVQEGRLRNVWRYADGTLADEVVYALTPTDTWTYF